MASNNRAEPQPETQASVNSEGVTIWERVERQHTQPTRTLDYGQIADAAITIADAHGLEAVSMRRLANVLGVATMGLYRYVSSKDDILWLMVDAAVGDVEALEADPGDWRKVVRQYAEIQRAALGRHPWMFEAGVRIALHLTPNRMALTERTLAALDDIGLDIDDQFGILLTIGAYVWGTAGGEMAMSQLMRSKGWETRDELRHAYGRQMSWLMGTGRYPSFQRYISQAKRKDDADWRFDFGLDCILDGIAARLGI